MSDVERPQAGEGPDGADVPSPTEVDWGGDRIESGERDGGLRVQSVMWIGVGLFGVIVGQIYGGLTHEQAGATLLTAAGVLSLILGVYSALPRRHAHDVDALAARRRQAREHVQIVPPERDGAWFPHASIWPFALGVGVFLVANGLLLGLWLFVPAIAFLAFAVVGWIVETRYRT